MGFSVLHTPFSLGVYVVMVIILFTISLVDRRERRIPNESILALIFVRLVAAGGTGLFSAVSASPGEAPFSFGALLSSSIVALFIGVLFIVLKIVMDRICQRESLGWGDVKLAVAGALFLTASQAFISLCITCAVGLCLAAYYKRAKDDDTFPFGPALCAGIALGILL